MHIATAAKVLLRHHSTSTRTLGTVQGTKLAYQLNMNNRNRRNDDDNQNAGLWGLAATAIGTVAVGAGLAYYFSQDEKPQAQQARDPPQRAREPPQQARPVRPQGSAPEGNQTPNNSVSDYLSNLLSDMDTPSNGRRSQRRGIQRSSIPDNPQLTNLNALLSDIYVRHLALIDDEFEIHYRVYNEIFNVIHRTMKEVDLYYKKYSSRVQCAGSHYDKLRIKKPDEFDTDIIIGLPLNINEDPFTPEQSDINLEPKGSGYVQLKMGKQFQNLHMRDEGEWPNNKAAYKWMDDRHYLLRSEFTDWFKKVVTLALNKHQVNGSGLPLFYVDGIPYTVRRSESGPAMTLYFENKSKGFKMDVDLVPCLKFPESRWLKIAGYRPIPTECKSKQGMWMVVPKPNKSGLNDHDKNRSWRIAMHDQERGLMFKSENMKQIIRLMKALRDTLAMKQVASYYVKTLFFWEVEERRNESNFWRRSQADLFTIMVKRLHAALVAGNIPYYWNKSNNLIGGVDSGTLKGYANKLAKLIDILENPNEFKKVAKYLLAPAEFNEYNARFLHI